MKKLFINIFLVLVACGILCSCGKKGNVVQEQKEPEKAETELIFSFESYKDITGTKLRVGEELGKTAINTDEEYITDGKASWMIMPQGDYGKETGYPFFEMQCLGTTFKSSDFSGYDKVMMDIYNAADEEILIEWSFCVINTIGAELDTEIKTCTLNPNSWNTIEYELTHEDYGRQMRLEKMKSMKVTLLTKKENKEDTVPTVYFDNLRGHFSQTERDIYEMDVNLTNGITFENELDQYVFTAEPGARSLMPLARRAYADIDVKPLDDSMGEYVLEGEAGDELWPAVNISFNETYEEGTVMKFMLYVEADPTAAAEKFYRFEAGLERGGKANTVFNGRGYFNKWIPVYIRFESECNKTYFCVNLDDDYGHSVLGDDMPRIYMDNFEIFEGVQELLDKEVVIKGNDVTFNNAFGRRLLEHTFDIPVKAGDTFSFDIDVRPGQRVAIWVLGDDLWQDEWYACDYLTWEGKKNLAITVPSDTKNMTVYVEYRDSNTPNLGSVVEIDNVKVLSLTEVSDDGTVKLTCPSFTGILRYNFKKPVKAGQVISFDIDVTPAEPVSVWVLGDGSWDKEYFARAYYTWEGKTKVIVNVPADIQNFTVETAFHDTSKDHAGSVVTISNLEIKERANVGTDGTVILSTLDNTDIISYLFDKPVKAGQTISFELDVNPAQPLSVWIFGDGDGSREYFAKAFYTWEGKEKIVATMPADVQNFMVFLRYTESGRDYTGNQAIISNLEIIESTGPKPEVGGVGIDGAYPGVCQYPIEGKAGEILSFDVIAPEGVPYGFWLLLDGVWGAGSEFFYTEQTKHIELELTKDITFIQLQGAGSNVQLEFLNIQVASSTEQEPETGNIVGIDGIYSGICKYPINAKAGDTVSFDVIAPEGVPYSFWLLLEGAWGAGSEFQYYETTKHVELVLGKDITFLQFQGAGSNVQLEFTNIKVTEKIEMPSIVGIDGNYPGICKYPIIGSAGQTLSFEVIEPTGVPYSFWLLLDGVWGAGSEFHYYEDKKYIELVLGRDITFIQLQGAGSNVQLEFKNIKVQ